MRVLGVIPARGGSKGIPRKNIRLLGGKPLLAWTIETAKASRRLTRVVLSTEDEEIAEVGRAWGVEVPFLRPRELAEDDTPTLPVLVHALEQCEREDSHYDAVCLLQPTAPLRRTEWIDDCVTKLAQSGADSVVTVLPIPAEHHPWWSLEVTEDGWLKFTKEEGKGLRRQDLPPAFHRDGSVYVMRRHVLLGGSLYGDRIAAYEVSADETVNLDTEEDWRRAEGMIAALRCG